MQTISCYNSYSDIAVVRKLEVSLIEMKKCFWIINRLFCLFILF